MEILNENVAMLSNYEVYHFLTSEGEKAKKSHSGTSQHLATITYETKKYLSNTPCVNQTSEIVTEFLKRISKYKLTRAEKLQLLNIRPTKLVEMQLVIEELEERFSEDKLIEILEIISELPDNEMMET